MKKISKLIPTISVVSSISLTVTPALSGCSLRYKDNEYHIISVNDVHGAMAGYGETVVDVSSANPGCLRLAREINKIKNNYPDTLVVSGGDENSGDCWTVCSHGETTYPILSSMDIRYAAVGNHAFEWGLDDMASGKYDRLGRTDKTQGKYFVASNILNSNIYQTKNWCIDPNQPNFQSDFTTWLNQKVAWADPYKIVNFGPAKVCLIGLATQNTLIDGNKKITNLFSFIDYNVSIHYTKHLVKQEIGEDQFNQIDSFILLTHCDSDYTDKILTGEAARLAGTVDTDIDAIISAHSHKAGCGRIYNNILNKPIWIGQAGTACQYYLDTKLSVSPKAKQGHKIENVSMSLHKIPIPEDSVEAQNEWEALEVTDDPSLKPVAVEYGKQKTVVEEKVSEILSEANLDPTKGETQNDKSGKPFNGYYNGILESGKKIGHEYYDCVNIIDHLGGWACRAIMLGYAIQYWKEIQQGTVTIPSCCFLAQDSLPSNVKNGAITYRNMFSLQPHDNYGHVVYLSIMQLANIINYSLAGNPEIGKLHKGTGFNYTEKYQYEPDLCYFNAVDESGNQKSYKVAFNVLDDNDVPVINSGYACGIMPLYGIKFELVEIDDTKERTLSFQNPVTGNITPFYDSSAKYRLKTKDYTINGEKVTLPVMSVYDGSNDGKGVKWGSMDRSDDPDCWKSADKWYEAEHPGEGKRLKLIPVLINTFNYNGGNTQSRMFKQYEQYNILTYGLQFYTEDTPETFRDFLVEFCRNSRYDVRKWSEYVIPTNIVWSQIKNLVTKPS